MGNKALAIISCKSIGGGYSYVNQLSSRMGEAIELLDTFTSARGEQVFFILVAEKKMESLRGTIGEMYQDESFGSGIEVVLVEDLQSATLAALAGLPAAPVKGSILFVESMNIGHLLRSYNQICSRWADAVVTGDFQLGLGQGGIGSYFLGGDAEVLKEVERFLLSTGAAIDCNLLVKIGPALNSLFSLE